MLDKTLKRLSSSFYLCLSVAVHAVILLVQIQPPQIFIAQPKNPLSEEDLIEISEAESVLGERVVPESEQSKKLVRTEAAQEDSKAGSEDQLSDRSQTVDKETRAPIGEAFFTGDPVASGGSEDSLQSLGLLPDAYTMGDQTAGPNKSEHGVPDFEIRFGSTRDEYLEGIDGGPRTLLNTKEFAHWIYFDRIKQKIAPKWRPEVQRRARALVMSQRKLKDGIKRTKVYVELDSEGNLVDLAVVASSQSGYLDEAAIKAFKDVGRFPNPPQELLKNNKVKFNWDFILDVNEKRIARSIERPKKRDRIDRLN